MDNATMIRKRPIGVGIIAVLVAIGGIITLIAASYWFLDSAFLDFTFLLLFVDTLSGMGRSRP
jgi:hypothetical protein